MRPDAGRVAATEHAAPSASAGRRLFVFRVLTLPLYLLSMMITVVGVFIMPILGVAEFTLISRLFGLSMLLFAGYPFYPFALSGHYGLWAAPGRRQVGYFPFQEKVVFTIVILVAVTYLTVAFIIK